MAAELFAEIADEARLGGKARSLARLAAAGLPTPPGFVITDHLFRALCPALPALPRPLDAPALRALAEAAGALAHHHFPDRFSAALTDRLRRLGGEAGRFAVRSSFAGEDRPGALAPGIYESRVDVPLDQVETALREVLASALGAGAAAYAQARGELLAAPPVAVLVHAQVSGTAQGSAASDPSREEGSRVIDVRSGDLDPGARAAILSGLTALTGRFGPVEIEWVAAAGAVTFLQLRPYQAPSAPRAWPGYADLPAGERPQDWRWDAAHNPLPLSTAHAGLVAAADARCRIGIRQRVLGGYLFWRPDPQARPAPLEGEAGDLDRMLADLEADIEAYRKTLDPPATPPSVAAGPPSLAAGPPSLAAGPPSLAATPPSLADTLTGFFPLYERIFGRLQPAARAARQALVELLSSHLPGGPRAAAAALPGLLSGVASRASERARLAALHAAAAPADRPRTLAAYLGRFGDEAPRWDIAAPTYAEEPGALSLPAAPPPPPPAAPAPARPRRSPSASTARRTGADSGWQQRAASLRDQLPLDRRADFDRLLTNARQAAAAGEDDDWLYARLQRPVRRAVLALGERLSRAGALPSPAAAFCLPLDWLLAYERGRAGPAEAADLAARGHAAEASARRDPPPFPGPPGESGRLSVRGAGTAGRALGRVVHRHGPQGTAPGGDAILVATSLLPTELPLLQVAALVTETGGPLDHVAAQARERGLPAVVGAPGALALFPEGALVLVDADRGLVVRCD